MKDKVPIHDRESAAAWLRTPLGDALKQQEARMVEEALDGIFGEYCLQLGQWGGGRDFLKFARTQRSVHIIDPSQATEHTELDIYGQLHRLPIASDSIDVVLLPHTLDYSDRPHAILREVHRILRSDGQLIVLGFKPGGLWGLRRLIPGAGLPPATENLISDRRLSDWLRLLDMRIHGLSPYFFRWPLPRNRASNSDRWERHGRRLWPELSACYMLTAQKRLYTLTAVKRPWRATSKVVGGLVKPTTRISRIRFDENS